MTKHFLRIGLLALALALFGAGAAWAQGGSPTGEITDDEVNQVAKQLYCPVCENVPLDVCPTQACIQWRATIKEKLAEGWTEQQILSYFVEQYGERVLAQPSARGLNVLIWVLPPLALAAGAVFLWRFLKRSAQTAPARAPGPVATPPADKYADRLEQELQKRY